MPQDSDDCWLLNDKQLAAFKEFLRQVGGTMRLAKLVAPLQEPIIAAANAARYIRAIKSGDYRLSSDKLELYAKATFQITRKDFHALYSEIILLKPIPPLPPQAALPELNLQGFYEFFGDCMLDAQNPVQLYFPMRELKASIEQEPEPPFQIERPCTFKYEGKTRADVWPEGICTYLAFESAVAAVELSTFFKKMTGTNTWVRHENSSAFSGGVDSCVISFGLGFSAVTRIAEKHFNPKLFTVYCAPSPKPTFRHPLTDHFTLGSRQIEVPEDNDIALLVRVVRKGKKSRQPVTWFICAGRTTTGTAAAAHYLTHNWSELRKIYIDSQKSLADESLAVVIQHKESMQPGRDISLDAVDHPIKSAKLHYWSKDNPAVAFGLWNEVI